MPIKTPKRTEEFVINEGGTDYNFKVEQYDSLIRIIDDDDNNIDLHKRQGRIMLKLDGHFEFKPRGRRSLR